MPVDKGQLDELNTRALRQAGLLEELHIRAAVQAFGGKLEPAPFERRP